MEQDRLEVWKSVIGFGDKYQVSNLGRVRKTPKDDCEKLFIYRGYNTKDGYKVVSLYKDGRAKTVRIHRLVMTAFRGYSNLEIHHKNGNKADNRLNNLEYVTHEQNMQYERKHQQKKQVTFNDLIKGA